jgi:N-acetylneuraminic acid mutarotase
MQFKPILLFAGLLLHSAILFSQNGTSTFLTWMKGDNTIDQVGIYGTKGQAAVANKPGSRDFSATWKDNNGHLWLFGGYGYDGNVLGYLNDLWKYNPATNQWTWIKGDSIIGQFGVDGMQGAANIANKPGALSASSSWTDNNGNFWLFGGFGYTNNDFGFLNDLWKYNPASNQWAWIKGDGTIDQAGIYGMRGIANTVNKPGARYGSRTWTDGSGNLWLFGGFGLGGNSTQGMLNDLWKYDRVNNQWTWVNGDDVVDQPGVYGQKGIAATTNKPGARYVSVSWKDNNDNLWLFGGNGFDRNTSGSLNDLWKYNLAANKWTWINGDSSVNQNGVYGVQGMADAANKPGARYVSVSWTDVTGNLWLFGGYGYAAGNEGYLNDLWKFNSSTDKWTWIKGDDRIDQVGVYGTQGVLSSFNKSGSRTSCVSWSVGNDELWLFGGYGFDTNTSGILNDLWKISNIFPLPLQLLHFNGALNNDVVHLQWQTSQELNFSHFTVQRSFDGINFSSIGSVNSSGNVNGDDYSFYDNTLYTRPEQKVFYRLQLTDNNGHFTYSRVIRFDLAQPNANVQISPNPATYSLNLSFNQIQAETVIIQITDMTGKTVLKQIEYLEPGRASTNIDVSALSAAPYILSLINTQGAIHQKFIKQ